MTARHTWTLVAMLSWVGLGRAPVAIAAAEDGVPDCVAAPFRELASSPFERSLPPVVARGTSRAIVPATGDVHLLVILAQYPDRPALIAPARFQSHLFGTTGFTFRRFYEDLSEGALSVTGDVWGWLTLPQTQSYYAGGTNGAGVGPYPNNGQRMTEDAVQAAVTGGLDLSDYDANGDGVVDALLVIHSGQGYEWAVSSALTPETDLLAINSHKWSVVDGDFGSGQPRIADYFTCPELQLVRPTVAPLWADSIATIGVYCHEFGHVLGLPDFYDTETFDDRVGQWDLMDYGTWNRVRGVAETAAPGALPGSFSAWSRAYLGWNLPEVLAAGPGRTITASRTLTPIAAGGSAVQLRSNPGDVDWRSGDPGSGEFFLAEMRTPSGWDAGLPGGGVLLYHVDESRATNRASAYPDGGGLLTLEPQDADLSLTTGITDPWPGAQSVFDESSLPSSHLFDESESGVEVVVHSSGATSASATFTVTNSVIEVALPYASPNPWLPDRLAGVSLQLTFEGPAPDDVIVTVHDATGRRVRTLDASSLVDAGRAARWDGTNDAGAPVPAGMYFFRVHNGIQGAGRVLLLR
ncbi:MAG: M6 family metalloprotease domain-containing protein [Gemmatimonadetes bacterium]|nr:M6 family metalloprotease domain-containing protein [Gemmatimonadota bacterium]